MNLRLIRRWETAECDVLIVPRFHKEGCRDGLVAELNRKLEGFLEELEENGEWNGEAGHTLLLHRSPAPGIRRVTLIGMGSRDKFDLSLLRRGVSKAISKLRNTRLRRPAVLCRSEWDSVDVAQVVAEGVLFALYTADDYKTGVRSELQIDEVLLAAEGSDGDSIETAFRKGLLIGEATNLARRLANEPGNRLPPVRLAEIAEKMGRETGLEVEVLDEREMEKRGMHAVLAVAQGSEQPPRLILLRHHGASDPADPPLVFVGKGVTFDSGGLSLKPAQSMEEMKSDKAGACAVIAAMQGIAKLRVPRNVVGIVPAVENLPGGRAQRPGDVIATMSGKTVEVLNTDAEGRLILADALHLARSLNPTAIIDLATLTGACMVALGTLRAGLFSNDDSLAERLERVSTRTGERLWRLPLDDEYRKEIESTIADLKNIGNRWGGAITAAKFLQEFVGEVPWCHLDIAGVDLFKNGNDLKGPTGFGTRTLIELALDSPD